MGSPTGMSTRCLASGPVMLPSPRRLPRSLRTEPPALARQPWQTCTGRTGSWSCKQVAPSADPLPADLPHLGPRTRVTARSGSGRALPHFPRSKARPDSDHVAVVLALGRAPSSAVDDEAGALFQHSPSPWRHALRRFLLASSRTASPRPLPSRLQIVRQSRHPCCHERWGGRSPQATRPCSTVEFVVVPDVAIASDPFLPWACVPSRLFAGFANAKRRSGAHLMSRPGGAGVCAEARRVRPDRHDGPGHEPPKRLGPDLRGTITGSRSTQVRSVPPSPGDESPFADGDFIGSKSPKRLRSSR